MSDISQLQPKEFDFIQGYNDGYTMGQYDRPTAYKIVKMIVKFNDDYALGFKSGEIKSRELIKVFEQTAHELTADRIALNDQQAFLAATGHYPAFSTPSYLANQKKPDDNSDAVIERTSTKTIDFDLE